MKTNAPIPLLVLVLAAIVPGFASDLEKTLKHQYEKHLLDLRNSLQQTNLEFDPTGKPLYQTSRDRWVVYGGIRVKKVSLGSDRLRVEGPWVAFGGTEKEDHSEIIPLGKDVKVEIHLDHPLLSADDARAVLGRVFFLDPEGFEHVVPEFRRSDFEATNETIYKIDKKDSVVAPLPKYTPEPDYSREARKNHYQGVVVLEVVVDKGGAISRIRIQRALGMGLDLQAVEAVKKWRFEPASRNGEPVAVKMNVDVSFNLY
jgi:TonB family protein